MRALVHGVSDLDKGGVSLTSASHEIGAEEFRRRQSDARRSGNPAWLWPEVSVDSWAAAAAHVSDAASAILAGQTATLVADDPLALSLACLEKPCVAVRIWET